MSELRQRIQDVIQNEPVAVFMKGTPQFVMCGNSDRALRALREAGAPVTGIDVLADPAIRQELSEIDRKSTRLNSSHLVISYAVFCLKKKTQFKQYNYLRTRPYADPQM